MKLTYQGFTAVLLLIYRSVTFTLPVNTERCWWRDITEYAVQQGKYVQLCANNKE